MFSRRKRVGVGGGAWLSHWDEDQACDHTHGRTYVCVPTYWAVVTKIRANVLCNCGLEFGWRGLTLNRQVCTKRKDEI